mmetsp:Transcript_23903/g.55290  ORF Transcript_23903/g.55290 Transcript_23903/m.55290 type:complete len:160 (+) Transcript_23903:2-481(+)
MGAFFVAFAAFSVSSYAASGPNEDYLRTSFASFLLFEFCCGVYFPSVGVLKSDVVPEKVRGTVYNLYRVPLNGIVVSLLLSSISMATCFKMNALLLLAAFISITSISGAKSIADGPAAVKYDVVSQGSAEGGLEMVSNEPSAVVVGRRRVSNDVSSDPV